MHYQFHVCGSCGAELRLGIELTGADKEENSPSSPANKEENGPSSPKVESQNGETVDDGDTQSNASLAWLQAFIYKHKRLPTQIEYGETKFAGGQCHCSYTGQCALIDHPLMKNFSDRRCYANMLRDVIKNDRERDSCAISPNEAVPGKFYDCKTYGRVLCCGTSGEDWLPAFAVRVEGRTQMRYLHKNELTESDLQCW